MELAFRHRDYRAEKQAFSLPRTRVETHPLSASSPAPLQVEEPISGNTNMCDPLRAADGNMIGSAEDISSEVDAEATSSCDSYFQLYRKERDSFKRILMQKFPISKAVPMSMVTGLFLTDSKGLIDHHNIVNDVQGVNQQDYVSQLHGLRDDVKNAWCSDDKVTSLRLSIKVARLLMDTKAIQFYPTLFVLVTDIMDMLGDLVWNRIKQKSEFDDEQFICSLSDNFQAAEVRFDAKETCNNWFFKISSVCELLPRIYLELAVLPCWRFLLDHPEEVLERLVLMIRGIADPLASAYCRLYLAQCSHRLPRHDTRYLVTCINDLNVVLSHLMATKAVTRESSKLLFTLIEPCIEYTIRCLFKDKKQMEVGNLLAALGIGRNPPIPFSDCSRLSIILHHILKELPIDFICSNALEMLHITESIDDHSFDQCLNFKLLGFRLCERISKVNKVNLVVDKVMQVLFCYDGLDMFLMFADAYLEIIFDDQDAFPKAILSGIYERATTEELDENSMFTLQSVIMKILSHFGDIKDILIMDHFIDILDMMIGSPRNLINMYILGMTAKKGCIRDPTVIEVLFQVAKVLSDDIDFLNLKMDEYHHKTHVISRFISMVDFGMEVESQLRFFSQCRMAFASICELQEMIIHAINNLAVKTMRDVNCSRSFIKSCITFSEITIPSIRTSPRQLNLYIETAEVALLGGFVSHSHELLIGALNCLEDLSSVPQMLDDVDWTISLICKLCGMMVMVPGSMEQGMTYIPRHLLSYLDSISWILPRMRIKVLCAILFLLAASSQKPLLHHATSPEVMSNDQLFFDVPAYHQELLLLSAVVLENVVNTVLQEPALVVRGKIALEMLYCIASSLVASEETSEACSKLAEISRLCLSADNKFLQFVFKFLGQHRFVSVGSYE